MQWLRSGLSLLGLFAAVCTPFIVAAQPPPAPPAGPNVVPPPAAQVPAPPPAPPPAAANPPAAQAPVPPPAGSGTARAPKNGAKADAEENGIVMNFQDVDLDQLVKFISEITGRNFILDDRVKGKVTIISPGKISVDEAYAVFNSVLQVKGFTTVPSGAVLKILPSQEAKSSTVETVFPGAPRMKGDEFITKLMKLENVDVNNMLGIVQPLVSANGLLAAYTATNTMIIIDSASNIDRISNILKELDVDVKDRGVEVVRLNYAFAGELAATLAQVLEDPANAQPSGPVAPRAGAAAAQAAAAARNRPGVAGAAANVQPVQGGTGAASYKIIPDERTNALILVAGPLEMRKIKDLIVRLDVPLPFGTGRIHVYYLKYANAFEIVPVLSDLIGGQGGPAGLGAGLAARGLAGQTSFRGGRLGQQGGLGGLGSQFGSGTRGQFGGGGFGGSSFGGGGGFGGGGFGGGTGGSLRGGRGGGFGGGGLGGQGVASVAGGGGGEFEGEVRITADPSTNALIINASPQDYETLKQVIVQLDVRRRQVYVEAIVMEVRLSTQRALGIEMQGAAGTGNGVLLGRVNFRNLNAFADPTGAALGSITGLLAAAASNQTIRLPNGTVVPAQQLIITAAESNDDVNILSAPNIVTTDNQEAEIVVGQNVPFIASTSTSETNLGNVFNTVERRDVGITLRLTPQISEGGMVRLDIFEEVSALVQNSLINANQLGPVTTIRSATTSVVVRDKQTVVIGGLISDGTDNQENSVPFLSDIPVLGNLFRSTSGMREKINLLIFLTPHIIRDAAEHRDKSVEERDKMKAFMEERGIRYRKRKILDNPSWTPDIPKEGEATGGGDVAENKARGATIYSPPPLPPSGSTVAQAEPQGYAAAAVDVNRPAIEAIREQPAQPAVPRPPARYVLLAAFAQMGTPPPGLQTDSGLIAVELPQGSSLSNLFEAGSQYRFTSDKYEGYYRVLEAYPTAQEALLLYPEGMPVDAAKGDYLHWRTLDDSTSSDVTAWSALQ